MKKLYYGQKNKPKKRKKSVFFLKKTNCSEILLIKLHNKKYILKRGLNESIEEEFLNHKKVYSIYKRNKENVSFIIPKVYSYNKKANFYIMEYIQSAMNLQEIIFNGNFKTMQQTFYNLGKAIKSYHSVMTNGIKSTKIPILEHGTVKTVLESEKGVEFKKNYNEFPKNSYCRIFKDFKSTNVLVNKDNKINLIDFQKIYYYAPFYYDLARFIDTIKVFTFVKSPLYYIVNRKKINRVLRYFIKGYGEKIEIKLLNNARKMHQEEHIYMKREKGEIINSIILKFIYKIGI